MAKTKRRTYQTVIQALCLMLDGAYMLLAGALLEMCFRQKKFGMEDIGAVAVITVHRRGDGHHDLPLVRQGQTLGGCQRFFDEAGRFLHGVRHAVHYVEDPAGGGMLLDDRRGDNAVRRNAF